MSVEPAPWDLPVGGLSEHCRAAVGGAVNCSSPAQPGPSLDTMGTSRKPSGITYKDLLYAGDAPRERRRIASAFRSVAPGSEFWPKRNTLERRANRLEDCGKFLSTYADAKANARVAANSCDDAMCNRCSYHRTRKIRARYEAACAIERSAGRRIRMLTLTQPVVQGETWGQAQARLMRQWRRFWQHKETKKKITGALRRIETTWSWKSKGWHVHIHLAYAGKFWISEELGESWSRAGAGKIVDAREVYRDAELFKYLVKTAKTHRAGIVEYAIQSAGRRLLELLGTWKKIQIPEEAEAENKMFEVEKKDLVRAVKDPESSRWILNGILKHFDDPEPLDLARWAARVLSARDREIEKLSEREARRFQKEHKRRISALARARTKQISSAP